MKKAKKIIALLLALTMMLAMTSCAQKTEEQEHIHKIGVIVYDLKDEQVQAFREYMEGYLGENFSDVDFLYSAGVTTDVEEMEFLNNAIAAGVEGIIILCIPWSVLSPSLQYDRSGRLCESRR